MPQCSVDIKTITLQSFIYQSFGNPEMMKEHEYTPHRLAWICTAPSQSSESKRVLEGSSAASTAQTSSRSGQVQRRRHEVLPGGSSFVVNNFLSLEECLDLIRQAETIGLYDCGYNPSIRKTHRVAASSDKVSQILFQRLKPFLEDVLDLSVSTKANSIATSSVSSSEELSTSSVSTKGIPVCVSQEKKQWYPTGLNPVFRICRYRPGDFFCPHQDGAVIVDPYKHRSLRTFMIYLNDNFDGGHTHFYNDLQRQYSTPNLNHMIHTYQPKTGDLLVFNSEITHDGGQLLKGQKYILRSEVMYQTKPTTSSLKTVGNQKPSTETPPDYDPDAEFTWP